MVQMIQFLHMQGDPFHFLNSVLNTEIFFIVLIPLLIEFHNLAPSPINMGGLGMKKSSAM